MHDSSVDVKVDVRVCARTLDQSNMFEGLLSSNILCRGLTHQYSTQERSLVWVSRLCVPTWSNTWSNLRLFLAEMLHILVHDRGIGILPLTILMWNLRKPHYDRR